MHRERVVAPVALIRQFFFRLGLLLCLFSILSACASSRKISQVGLREKNHLNRIPQSEESTASLRESISRMEARDFGPCPQELKQEFPRLAEAVIEVPSCPDSLGKNLQLSMNFLRLEERSLLEGIQNAKCQSFSEEVDLENFLTGFESSGPIGRREQITETFRSEEGTYKVLTDLKHDLEKILQVNVPISRWVNENGVYVFGDGDFRLLKEILIDRSCSLKEMDMEAAYQAMQRLESLSRVLKEDSLKHSVDQALEGMHRLLDDRILEFFYPHGKR